jgi:hypothetical protein
VGREGPIDREQKAREKAWVERARGGDARAFRELYDLAFRIAWIGSIRTVGDPALAEELTARALRRAFASLGAFDGRTSFGAWILRFSEGALRELKADACPPVAVPGAAPERPLGR